MNLDLGDVLLVVEDPERLKKIAAQLRKAGVLVRCAPTLDEAASLLRAGPPPAYLFVRLGGKRRSAEELKRELGSLLPGWTFEVQPAAGHERKGHGARLLN
jgi:hypothetical protein